MNLPNSLTLLRITIVPFFVTVLLTEDFPNRDVWGIVIFLTASLTDLLDGWIARRRRQVTTMGIILDPIADKLLISAAFISLVQRQMVPAWMVVIIIGREFAVSGLRNIASSEGLTIRASTLGKAKMIFQVIAVCLILAGAHWGGIWSRLGLLSLWVVLLVAIWSMVHYFFKFWGVISQQRRRRIRRRRLFRRKKKGSREELHEKSNDHGAAGVPLPGPQNPS